MGGRQVLIHNGEWVKQCRLMEQHGDFTGLRSFGASDFSKVAGKLNQVFLGMSKMSHSPLFSGVLVLFAFSKIKKKLLNFIFFVGIYQLWMSTSVKMEVGTLSSHTKEWKMETNW